jgi:hypothetical protein
MASQPWLDRVRQRLVENRLPPAYVRRFMDELADHLQDITEETMSTETNVSSRLGEPNQVANAAADAYRRTFWARHASAALLVFGVSPLVALLGLFVLSLVGLLGVFWILERLGVDMHAMHLERLEPAASVVIRGLLSLAIVVLPGLLASVFYCKLARRLNIGRKWMLLSCVVLAAVAATPVFQVHLSAVPGHSNLACGLGVTVPTSVAELWHWVVWLFGQQSVQFIPPLLVGFWFLRRSPTCSRPQPAA